MFASPDRKGFSKITSPSRDDAGGAAHVVRQLADQDLGAEGGLAQLGMGEEQIVDPLGHMVGKLVGQRPADAVRRAVGADQVDAGQFGLFAAIQRKARARSAAHRGPRRYGRCPCRTIRAARRPRPAPGVPPSRPMRNIFMLSVRVSAPSSLACIASRVAAEPRWVRPVPVRCIWAGSGWLIGRARRPLAASDRQDRPPRPDHARRSPRPGCAPWRWLLAPEHRCWRPR